MAKGDKTAGKVKAATAGGGAGEVGRTDVRQREMRGEFAGLVLLFAGAAFALSLVSHDPRDMAAVAAGKGFEQIGNWLGPVGARMADLLLHFFGLGAFLINALVLLLALATLTGRMRAPRFGLAAGALGLLSVAVIHDKHWLLLSMTGVGIAWASILAMPYAILSASLPPAARKSCCCCFATTRCEPSSPATPARTFGARPPSKRCSAASVTVLRCWNQKVWSGP